MTSNTPSIGDIVALNSHPYHSTQTNILIGGEPQLTSPLMVVVETVGDAQNSFDENVGMQIHDKGKSCQCKCIWYSTKSHQFEEVWISSKVLKKTTPKDLNHTIDKQKFIDKSIGYGSLVTLKTSALEIAKQKSSISIESNREKSTINPILSLFSVL